jgi:hypothetical protein
MMHAMKAFSPGEVVGAGANTQGPAGRGTARGARSSARYSAIDFRPAVVIRICAILVLVTCSP